MRKYLALVGVLLAHLAWAQPVVVTPPSPITQLPVTQLQGGTDYNPAELPHWRAAIQNVVQGNSNTNVLVIGDSTTFGGTVAGTFIPKNFTYWLAADLTAVGVPANNNGWCGMSTGGSNLGSRATEDPRIAPGGFNTTSTNSLGGYFAQGNGSVSNALVYTPGTSIDTFQTLVYNNGGGASITFTATGGTGATETASGFVWTTASAGSVSSSNTLSAVNNSGIVNIACETAYSSATKQVNIFNAGWYGSTSANWLTHDGNAYGTTEAIQALAPSLTIIRCCINDIGSISPTTTVSNIANLVAAAQLSGDVVIDDENPTASEAGSSNAGSTNTALQAYAVSILIPFVDTWNRWQSYAISTPLGYYSDSIHPTQLGYGDLARADAKVLSAP